MQRTPATVQEYCDVPEVQPQYSGSSQSSPADSAEANPSHFRILELQKKLSGLQKGLEEGKVSFHEQVEAKLKVLDERISRAQVAEDSRWRVRKQFCYCCREVYFFFFFGIGNERTSYQVARRAGC